MTFRDFYVLAIIIIYLLAFFIRNLRTYFSVKTSIRGRSLKLTISILLSSSIYAITLVQLIFPATQSSFGKITVLQIPFLLQTGYGLILMALIVGLAALYEMKNSWRVGIKIDQKTDLVTTGIYSLSRNPYFLSYNMLFMGLILIHPSVVLLLLNICLAVTFHQMILEEEAYLEEVQGESYLVYKKNAGRYF